MVNWKKCFYTTKEIEIQIWNKLKYRWILQGCICNRIKNVFQMNGNHFCLQRILFRNTLQNFVVWKIVIFKSCFSRNKAEKATLNCFVFERFKNLGMNENSTERERENLIILRNSYIGIKKYCYLIFKVWVVRGFLNARLAERFLIPIWRACKERGKARNSTFITEASCLTKAIIRSWRQSCQCKHSCLEICRNIRDDFEISPGKFKLI